jgi:hypothetical protein
VIPGLYLLISLAQFGQHLCLVGIGCACVRHEHILRRS